MFEIHDNKFVSCFRINLTKLNQYSPDGIAILFFDILVSFVVEILLKFCVKTIKQKGSGMFEVRLII